MEDYKEELAWELAYKKTRKIKETGASVFIYDADDLGDSDKNGFTQFCTDWQYNPEYDFLEPAGKMGMIDKDGHLCIPPIYDYIGQFWFTEISFVVVKSEKSFFFIDKKGHIIDNQPYDDIYLAWPYGFIVKRGAQCALINDKLEVKFDSVEDLVLLWVPPHVDGEEYDSLWAKKRGKWGHISLETFTCTTGYVFDIPDLDKGYYEMEMHRPLFRGFRAAVCVDPKGQIISDVKETDMPLTVCYKPAIED
jgi:hypothetical protein